MKTQRLGTQGPTVSALGLGCMSIGIADVYTSSVKDDDAAVALIHRAFDLGITLLDTANVYGSSEIQVGKALVGHRERAVVATKFGFVTAAAGNRAIDARPESVAKACDASLQRLGIEQIDLYYLHRVDPDVPIEETVGAMAELKRQGKVGALGLSEVSASTLRRAHAVHPIAAVQTEYSLWSREPEDDLMPTLAELGTALVAYSPLGRGFLAGRFRTPDDLAPTDWRRANPRFQDANFKANMFLAQEVERIAKQKGCTPAQLALAWLLTKPHVVPIPGTSSTKRLEENARATEVRVSAVEITELEQVAAKGVAVGTRYDEQMMRLVDQ